MRFGHSYGKLDPAALWAYEAWLQADPNLVVVGPPPVVALDWPRFLPCPCWDMLPSGACCLAGEQCAVMTPEDCATASGTYQGDGTDCLPNPCATTAPNYWLRVENGVPVEQGGDGYNEE